jgi:hypothetical protein
LRTAFPQFTILGSKGDKIRLCGWEDSATRCNTRNGETPKEMSEMADLPIPIPAQARKIWESMTNPSTVLDDIHLLTRRDQTGWLAWSDSNYGIRQDQRIPRAIACVGGRALPVETGLAAWRGRIRTTVYVTKTSSRVLFEVPSIG